MSVQEFFPKIVSLSVIKPETEPLVGKIAVWAQTFSFATSAPPDGIKEHTRTGEKVQHMQLLLHNIAMAQAFPFSSLEKEVQSLISCDIL